MRDFQVKKIAIIGQGYVGLPLAIAFSDYFPVIGFDINETRIDELRRGVDRTLEADKKDWNVQESYLPHQTKVRDMMQVVPPQTLLMQMYI